MVVGELDVVCVVVARVVDEAVDGVEGHPLDARLVAVGLQLHPVGPEDPDHPAHLVVAKVVHLARLLQQQHHVQHLHAHVLVSTGRNKIGSSSGERNQVNLTKTQGNQT